MTNKLNLEEINNDQEIYQADLHIHTVLSPCADLLMTPANIIKKAREVGLDLIAITDHNSAKNVEVTIKLAENSGLTVIPGMEVESIEEVHLLCLFAGLTHLLDWQEVVYQSLPDRQNNEDFFGYQLITDLNDDYLAKEERLLAAATSLSIQEISNQVTDLGGIVIPAHIDRPYNSLLANMGFISPDLQFNILELSPNSSLAKIQQQIPDSTKYSLLKSSDSHYLKDLKPMITLKTGDLTFSQIKLALENKKGRRMSIIR